MPEALGNKVCGDLMVDILKQLFLRRVLAGSPRQARRWVEDV